MNETDKYTESLAAFRHLLEIMDKLREKCPWDRAQTFEYYCCLNNEVIN